MRRFARETKLSETSFVLPSTHPEADYDHRIFMMSGEIPFAGHPSLGVAAAVARVRGHEQATLVQRTRPGLQPIDVRWLDELVAEVSMLQEPVSFHGRPDPADVLAVLGLQPEDADPGLHTEFVSTGVPQLLTFVRDRATLGRITPNHTAVDALLDPVGAVVLYAVALEPDDPGRAYARSYLRSAEMGEDPATGSAAGPLGAYLATYRDQSEVTIAQAAEMGRPSELRVRMEGDRVRVGGDAVVIAEGVVHLPV